MQDGDNESERASVQGGAVLYPREGGRDIKEALFFRVFVMTSKCLALMMFWLVTVGMQGVCR